jgi:acylphosphatase
MIKHLNITVQGKVQGVFYRASTKAVADQLGVKGKVKNLPDGSVYIEAEAEPWKLDLFLEWCHEGPEKARVTAVTSHEADPQNYNNFEVVKR